VPRTIAVFGIAELEERARELPVPFITKHNQGGKGLGVRRFDRHEDFDAYVGGSDFEPAVDGITLLQEYLFSAEPFITRAEFVGGRFVYAVRLLFSLVFPGGPLPDGASPAVLSAQQYAAAHAVLQSGLVGDVSVSRLLQECNLPGDEETLRLWCPTPPSAH